MSPSEMESKSTASENELKVTGYDDKDQSFIVTSPMGHILKISDTFAEKYTLMVMSPANSSFFIHENVELPQRSNFFGYNVWCVSRYVVVSALYGIGYLLLYGVVKL